MADDVTPMQAQMGLAGPSSFTPAGIPTPGPIQPMPYVRHPGDVAQQIGVQTQAVAMQSVAQGQIMRPMSGGGINTPLGAFAQQYQANQAAIASQQFNPFVAQAMAGMGGQQGYASGMMPSPIQMTSPSMGLFRPFAPPTSPMIPPMPQLPLFQTPITPRLPAPQFTAPLDYQYNAGVMRGDQVTAAAMATPGVLGHMGAAAGSAMLGASVGAYAGGRAFGRGGALFGSMIGTAAGLAGSEYLGVDTGVQHAIDALNPFKVPAIRAAQMHSMSQGFVVGGPDLSLTGRGLSTSAAARTSRMLEDVAFDPNFRRETGAMFSAQDMMRITRTSGDVGLLNMAQSPNEIKDQVKGVAKALKVMMQLMGEPDVQAALKSMGNLHQMGFRVAEMPGLAQNMRTYARMAGTTMQGITAAGQVGAVMYQQHGLSAATGFEAGMGAAGLAQQAVAAGSYTPRQLAMLGGVQGVAQRDLQANLATLRIPMMAAGVSTIGAGGTFGLDARQVHGLASGKINISGLANQAVANLSQAVGQHGIGAIGMAIGQQSELQDQLAQVLGPQGMQMMRMQQVMGTMKMMNLKGPGGFMTSAMAMGMDADTAKQMMGQLNNPNYFQNISQQLQRQRIDSRLQEANDRIALEGTGATRRMRTEGFVGDASRWWAQVKGRIGDAWSSTVSDVATNAGESAPLEAAGMYRIHAPSSSLLSSREQRRMRNLTAQDLSAASADIERASARYRGMVGYYDESGRVRGMSASRTGLVDRFGGTDADWQYSRRMSGSIEAGLLGNGVEGRAVYALNDVLGFDRNTNGESSSYDAVARRLSSAYGLSATEVDDVTKRLAERSFGGDVKKADAAIRGMADRVTKVANEKYTTVGGAGMMREEELDAWLRSGARQHGIDYETMRDLNVGGAVLNWAQPGFTNDKMKNPTLGPAGLRDAMATQQGVQDIREDFETTAFGRSRSFGDMVRRGVKSDRSTEFGFGVGVANDALSLLRDASTDTWYGRAAQGVYAGILRYAEGFDASWGGVLNRGDDATYDKLRDKLFDNSLGADAAYSAVVLAGGGSLSEHASRKAAGLGQKLLDEDPSILKDRKQLWESLQKYKTPEERRAAFDKMSSKSLALRTMDLAKTGMANLGLKSDWLAGKSSDQVLYALANPATDEDRKMLNSMAGNEVITGFTQKLKAAKTPEEQQEVMRQWAVSNAMRGQTERQGGVAGGAVNAAREKQITAAELRAANTKEAADAVFPEAVATFLESSQKLGEAADRLGRTDAQRVLDFLIPGVPHT